MKPEHEKLREAVYKALQESPFDMMSMAIVTRILAQFMASTAVTAGSDVDKLADLVCAQLREDTRAAAQELRAAGFGLKKDVN